MIPLILIRHGESTWNKENRFTGWTDVPLSEKGIDEAHAAAQVLRSEGYEFDLAYTSVLKRAIKTLLIIMEDLDRLWVDVRRTWHLNERHYGSLQGLNKREMVEKYGEQQVHEWRRSFDTPPPALTRDDERFAGRDPRYARLPVDQLPLTESLKDTIDRFMPYWHDHIVPEIKQGRRIIIAAHGNSLRALVKHLDGLSDTQITSLNIPTGVPLIYELDEVSMQPLRHFYLGDQQAIAQAIASVASQTAKK